MHLAVVLDPHGQLVDARVVIGFGTDKDVVADQVDVAGMTNLAHILFSRESALL